MRAAAEPPLGGDSDSVPPRLGDTREKDLGGSPGGSRGEVGKVVRGAKGRRAEERGLAGRWSYGDGPRKPGRGSEFRGA